MYMTHMFNLIIIPSLFFFHFYKSFDTNSIIYEDKFDFHREPTEATKNKASVTASQFLWDDVSGESPFNSESLVL